MFFWD